MVYKYEDVNMTLGERCGHFITRLFSWLVDIDVCVGAGATGITASAFDARILSGCQINYIM